MNAKVFLKLLYFDNQISSPDNLYWKNKEYILKKSDGKKSHEFMKILTTISKILFRFELGKCCQILSHFDYL